MGSWRSTVLRFISIFQGHKGQLTRRACRFGALHGSQLATFRTKETEEQLEIRVRFESECG